MAQPIDDTNDRRMLLRYTGRCRLCGATLTAGTDAIYERNRRTVRCVECPPTVPPPNLSPATTPSAQRPEDA